MKVKIGDVVITYTDSKKSPSVDSSRQWPLRPKGVWAYIDDRKADYASDRKYKHHLKVITAQILYPSKVFLQQVNKRDADSSWITNKILSDGYEAVVWSSNEIVFLTNSAFRPIKVVEAAKKVPTPDQLMARLEVLPISFKRENARKAIEYLLKGWTPHQINWHWPIPLEVWERICKELRLFGLCKNLKKKPLKTVNGSSKYHFAVLALASKRHYDLAHKLMQIIED